MSRFPTKESDVYSLSIKMFYGFFYHSTDFPSVDPNDFLIPFSNYHDAINALGQAKAVVKVAAKKKQDSLANLKTQMKKCLKLSEVDCADCPVKLSEIGWSASKGANRSAATSQPQDLHFERIASDKIRLCWGRPAKGSVVCYIIEKREADNGGSFDKWSLAGSSLTESITLCGTGGIFTEYRVIAQDPVHKSSASNTVAAVT
ncbi:MAG: fibronectin type III domain-containing protein [Phycisphaerae bacterium]|nr:fibronectin type III domain-containing protein [Phycisphaerae bacterium]